MQRPWQKQVLQQEKSRRQKGRWISGVILLCVLAVLFGVQAIRPHSQVTQAPPATPVTGPIDQSPTYSAVKGMWLGADESLWFHALGEPISRKTVGNIVILTMPLTHAQGIGTFYLEEEVRTHSIIAIDLIARSVWSRQDGVSLCSASAGEDVNLSRAVPLERGGAGFSQSLTVVGSSIQDSMSVFYFQGNPQAISACTASIGPRISQTYTPPV